MTPLARWVRVMARVLPRDQRDRYREQWLADLRDAPTQGIPARQIAGGATTFSLRSRLADFPGTPLQTLGLALCVLAATIAAGYALLVGSYPLGNSMPDDATTCQVAAEESNPGFVVDNTTPASAQRTWLPLGFICSVDVHRNGHPVVSSHQSWPATITVFASSALAMTLFIRLAVVARRRLWAPVSRLWREVAREKRERVRSK